MLKARRVATAFAAVLLLACTVVSAESESRQQATIRQEARSTASTQSLNGFLATLSSLKPGTAFSATTSQYCTRAIDPLGIACYIGCPDGCSCSDFGIYYSQCCCDISAE